MFTKHHRAVMAILVIICSLVAFTIFAVVLISRVQAPTIDTSKRYSVTLQRGACFGFCPAYQVSINADGKVIFDGERYTNAAHKEYNIDNDAMQKLTDKIIAIGFFNLNDRYVNDRITDLPSTQITVSDGTNTKTIYMYGLEDTIPAGLSEFATLIDDVTNTKQWYDSK